MTLDLGIAARVRREGLNQSINDQCPMTALGRSCHSSGSAWGSYVRAAAFTSMRCKRYWRKGEPAATRHVPAALVVSHHKPVSKVIVDRLRAAGKPHKSVITAVA